MLLRAISILDEFATITSQGMENNAEIRPSKSAAE